MSGASEARAMSFPESWPETPGLEPMQRRFTEPTMEPCSVLILAPPGASSVTLEGSLPFLVLSHLCHEGAESAGP